MPPHVEHSFFFFFRVGQYEHSITLEAIRFQDESVSHHFNVATELLGKSRNKWDHLGMRRKQSEILRQFCGVMNFTLKWETNTGSVQPKGFQ